MRVLSWNWMIPLGLQQKDYTKCIRRASCGYYELYVLILLESMHRLMP